MLQDGQFYEQRKTQAWNATQRSYVIRAPFVNAACSRRNERNPFKFDCRVEPRASISTSNVVTCVFFSYFFARKRHKTRLPFWDSTRGQHTSKISDKIAALRGKKNARLEAFVCHAPSVWKCSVLPNGTISEILSEQNFRQDCARASCCMCDVVFFSPAGQSS